MDQKTIDRINELARIAKTRELTAEETAQALGVPAATVRTRLKRARESLKARLEGWYFDE